MSVSAEEAERRVNALSTGLRDSGLRLTRQRLEVVREIAGADTHPDVEAIYRKVRERVPRISLDTVYRTLSTLVDSGLIDRVTTASGPARYDGNPFPHHHFVCSRCGAIHDIGLAQVDAIPDAQAAAIPGKVDTVQVEYRGICNACKPE